MKIVSSNNKDADFWIAKVGRCTGNPLKTPYTATNSYGVYSDNIDQDFARVSAAYESGLFKMYLYGSVQPFIRIDDLRAVLLSLDFINAKSLTMLNEVSKSIDLLINKVDKLKELKKSIIQYSMSSVNFGKE